MYQQAVSSSNKGFPGCKVGNCRRQDFVTVKLFLALCFHVTILTTQKETFELKCLKKKALPRLKTQVVNTVLSQLTELLTLGKGYLTQIIER